MLTLALVGLALSIDLTYLHVRVHIDPTYESWCSFDKTIDCDAVERSRFAVALGVPVSVWGILGYLVLIGVVLSAFLQRPASNWPRGALLGIGALFVLVSIENAVISFAVIKAVCVVCSGTYAVNLVLLAVAWLTARQAGRSPLLLIWSDIQALRRQWQTTAVAAACFALASLALIAWYPPYWKGKAELPGGAAGLHIGKTDGGSHWIGAAAPAVTIVEFSDYQCPFCARSHAAVRRAVAEQPDRLRLVHRHFPLDMECNDMLDRPFHPHACAAARAAECAAAQGKFWEMNDLLYLAQRHLPPEKIDGFVDRLSLDRAQFRACLASVEIERILQRDIDAAERLKARGTPFYLINGRMYRGALTVERLAAAVREAERAPASSQTGR